MPKMKTKKAAAKRFSLTASGKVKYKKMNLRHILTNKTTKRKRNLRKSGDVNPVATWQTRRSCFLTVDSGGGLTPRSSLRGRSIGMICPRRIG